MSIDHESALSAILALRETSLPPRIRSVPSPTEVRSIVHRMIAGRYARGEGLQLSRPARPTDDDVQLLEFVREYERLQRELTRALDEIEELLAMVQQPASAEEVPPSESASADASADGPDPVLATLPPPAPAPPAPAPPAKKHGGTYSVRGSSRGSTSRR